MLLQLIRVLNLIFFFLSNNEPASIPLKRSYV